MKKYLYSILLLFVVFLTGCGTKDVVYDTENTVDGSTDEEEKESEAGSGSMLSETLGIPDGNWKEEIGSGADKILIRAMVEVPEVTDMYTQEVSEHYYTPEEQKKIAEYFMDADTIQVNKKAVTTKEWVQKALNYYSDQLEVEEDVVPFGGTKEYIAMLSNEKKRLEALINEIPSINDVSESVQDYSENHYIGSKGDVEYTLSFDVDAETNTSSWTLEAVDGNNFTEGTIGKYAPWHNAASTERNDNICEMTKEQACLKAEELCRALGISDMKVAEVYDLVLLKENDETDGISILEFSEYNGYSIELTRNIHGVNVDIDLYYGDGTYLDTTTTEKPYDLEKVIVELNDKGIISMSYEGCMTAEDVGNAVKLLSFEQVQEIFRKELEGLGGESDTWRNLSLVYTRITDETMPDQYCYIPAWRLKGDSVAAKDNIWINAIDGSRIDPDKAGFIYYVSPKEHLKNMWIYFDRDNPDY